MKDEDKKLSTYKDGTGNTTYHTKPRDFKQQSRLPMALFTLSTIPLSTFIRLLYIWQFALFLLFSCYQTSGASQPAAGNWQQFSTSFPTTDQTLTTNQQFHSKPAIPLVLPIIELGIKKAIVPRINLTIRILTAPIINLTIRIFTALGIALPLLTPKRTTCIDDQACLPDLLFSITAY